MKKKQSLQLSLLLITCFSVCSFVFLNSRPALFNAAGHEKTEVAREAVQRSEPNQTDEKELLPDLSVVEKVLRIVHRVLSIA